MVSELLFFPVQGLRLMERKGDEAVKLFHRALEADSTHAMSYNSLGDVTMMRGQVDEAVELYEKAAELDPANGPILRNLQLARRRQSQRSPGE